MKSVGQPFPIRIFICTENSDAFDDSAEIVTLICRLYPERIYDIISVFGGSQYDNGPHNEGGADPTFFNTEERLRGLKRALYEGGMRVPYIAYWPGTIEAGSISDLMAAGWDMMPTFVELLGEEPNWRGD